jgi:Ser/Thr protein kinase RdoA (MazF antagonist)
MDDQQTYLLNGLLGRHFGLGRIVRFRQVQRGRQAEAFELFTAQEKEYLVQLFPPAYAADQLEFNATAVNALDAHRFSVVPFLPGKAGRFVAEGPQGSHMLVSLAPAGSILPAGLYTDHDISQIGLRLGWMHRLLKEQVADPPADPEAAPLADQVREVCATPSAGGPPRVPAPLLELLLSLLRLPASQGWVHGDIQPPALLVDADRQLRTVMDWGLLHQGAPQEDLIDAFLSFCTTADGGLAADRGRTLLESYHTLVPIARIPWTPVVASWCARRLLDAHAGRRPLPIGFSTVLERPEDLATALASCAT